jgi:hypothetical protein
MPQLARGISHAAELQRALSSLNHISIPGVRKWRYTFSDDWSGDPAVFFWVTLDDAASSKENLLQTSRRFQTSVAEHIDFVNDWDLVPYFNFRSASEQSRLQDESYG